MSDVLIKICADDVNVKVGELGGQGNKKMQIVRVLDLGTLSYLNNTETNYLNFVWAEVDTNKIKTFGIAGQTNMNPDSYEVFVNENNQGLDIQKNDNYITINGGLDNDWKFIIREI